MSDKLVIDEHIMEKLENIQLIITDIDGTLLKDDQTIESRTKQLLVDAHNMGIHTAIATGRAVDALPEEVTKMDCFEYVIASNGSNIYYMPEKKKVFDCLMSEKLVLEMTEVFKQYEFPLEASVDGKVYVPRYYYENPLALKLPARMFDYVRSTRHPVDDSYEFIGKHLQNIESLTLVVDDESLKEEIQKKIGRFENLHMTSSASHYIECNDQSAGKGKVLKKLCEMLGISLQSVLAFGDGENDMEMLRCVGIGAAMGNAPEIVKASADIVTLDNNHEGLAAVIENLRCFKSDVFLYSTGDEGVTITGLTEKGKQSAYLTVPEMIGGYQVIAIGDHAFYENRVVESVTLPDTVRKIESYSFAECRSLERVQMSLNIENIGDYAFYNCHSLKSVVLPGELRAMGYGAFKNCSALDEVFLYTDGIRELAAGALFDDTSHEMTVHVCDMGGKILTSLVLTEFDYDCILQVEARQFDWVYHGSGNVYRQCITKKGIDYEKYDSLFHSAIHEDWPKTALKIALGRVVYPYKLSETHQKDYVSYLKAHRQEVFDYYLKNQQADLFGKVLEMIGDEQIIKEWTETARDKNALGFVSLLMDFQRSHYGKKSRKFEL